LKPWENIFFQSKIRKFVDIARVYIDRSVTIEEYRFQFFFSNEAGFILLILYLSLKVLAVKLVSIHRHRTLLAARHVLEANINPTVVPNHVILLPVVTTAPAALRQLSPVLLAILLHQLD
jgi:hypothetical protein